MSQTPSLRKSGQAILEYVLLLVLLLAVFSVMAAGLRAVTWTLWKDMASRITGPTPMQKDPNLR